MHREPGSLGVGRVGRDDPSDGSSYGPPVPGPSFRGHGRSGVEGWSCVDVLGCLPSYGSGIRCSSSAGSVIGPVNQLSRHRTTPCLASSSSDGGATGRATRPASSSSKPSLATNLPSVRTRRASSMPSNRPSSASSPAVGLVDGGEIELEGNRPGRRRPSPPGGRAGPVRRPGGARGRRSSRTWPESRPRRDARRAAPGSRDRRRGRPARGRRFGPRSGPLRAIRTPRARGRRPPRCPSATSSSSTVHTTAPPGSMSMVWRVSLRMHAGQAQRDPDHHDRLHPHGVPS